MIDDKIPLLRNERNEWELPGGKLEFGEDPETCVVREIREELSLSVAVESILDAWVYDIRNATKVLIVTYHMALLHKAQPVCSHEHKELRLFGFDEIGQINMPEGYKASIRSVARAIGPRRGH